MTTHENRFLVRRFQNIACLIGLASISVFWFDGLSYASGNVALLGQTGPVRFEGSVSNVTPSPNGIEVLVVADSIEQRDHPLLVIPASRAKPSTASATTGYRFRGVLTRNLKSQLGPGRHKLFFLARPVGSSDSPSQVGDAIDLVVEGKKIPVNKLQGFNSDCRYFNDDNWQRFVGPLGTCDAKGGWNIRGTNERYDFQPAGFFLPDDAAIAETLAKPHQRGYWTYKFSPVANSQFQIEWNLDKTGSALDVANFSGAFLSLVGFQSDARISAPLFVDIRLQIKKAAGLDDKDAGAAKFRSTLGAVTHWTSKTGHPQIIFLEVNLFRSANFDLCAERNIGDIRPTGFCDPQGIYDRKNYFDVGEIVYYDLNSIHKVSGALQGGLQPDGTSKEFTIPIANLFKNYSWTNPPDGWETARIEGIYLGHEIWGRGVVSAVFENMQIYRFIAD